MLKTIELSAATQSPHGLAVFKGAKKIRGLTGRVYQTFCDDGDRRYVLQTTSKDIHLNLGLTSHNARIDLIRFLADAFDAITTSVLLSFRFSENEVGATLLFVKAADSRSNDITFHISPAH